MEFCIEGQGGFFVCCLIDWLFYICLCLAAVNDWRNRKIPNYCSVAILVLAVIKVVCHSRYDIYDFAAGACAAGIPFAVLHVIKPRDLGRADVKLTAAAGAYAGYRCILISVVLGVGMAVFYCVWCMVLKGRKKSGRIIVPLGSCISLGMILCYSGCLRVAGG